MPVLFIGLQRSGEIVQFLWEDFQEANISMRCLHIGEECGSEGRWVVRLQHRRTLKGIW